MVKIKNSLSSKLLSMLLAFSILIGMVPSAIVSAYASSGGSVGTVETLVNGGTVDGSTVIFDNITLEWSAKDDSIGRWTDGWWVGIKVTAPSDVDLENATYQYQTATGWDEGNNKSFKQFRDSTDESATQYITLWGIVNEAYLNNAIINGKEYLNYGYRFDWDGDGNYDNAQVVTMRVNPNTVKLNKDGVQEYPKASGLANVEFITTGVEVSNNGGSIVVLETTSDVVLNWYAKDESIGRGQDGWWIGYKVVAPAYADIENAKYQHKTSEGWTDGISFAENKDTENSIGVWRLVNETYLNNAIANNTNVNYTTRYDWDNDGVYEQIITLKINPSKVTLIAENGEQVYPYLGTVIPLTGGTVEGNTSNFELVIDNTTLNWSAKDESIGRNYDGWWVGMKVTAPQGYTVDQLKNATYKSRVTSSGGTAWSDYSANKKFWDMKDSADGDATHHIGMWMVITPSLLTAYKNNGKDIKTEYVFDWDGNGTADQTITMTVDPDGTIVLNKVEQTGFEFVEPYPVDKWVGETYTNSAFGGQGTGAVTYVITSGTDVADIDTATGKLTFKKVGTVTVKATKAADDTYAEATSTYTVKSIKYPQAEFKFKNSNSNITVEFADGSFINTVTGGSGEGSVKYSIVSGGSVATIDENSGEVTFIKAGDITIVAKKAADANYNETIATYTLKIEKSNQQPLDVTHPEGIIYNPNAKDVFNVADNKCGNGEITYSIIEGSEYATIDSTTGKVTTEKSGTIKVQIDKAGDDGYNAATPYVTTIVIYKAAQKGFAFADKDPDDVTYNDNNNKFSNAVSGGQGIGAITYAFKDSESEEIADINSTTGEITINAAGTINVIAIKSGDDCYNAITAEYSLVVKKDTPEFTVGNVDLVYGVKEYQINVNTTVASADYIYSVEGANNIGASIDANGKVTFENSTGKVGTITVKVKREADNCYNELEKTFKLTVSYHNPSAQPVVSGATKNETGWYTGVVTITAPNGYQISYSNELTGTIWSDNVTVNTDGVNSKSVYLKNGNEISNAISLDSIKIDTAAPTNVKINYSKSFFEKALETITFGIYEAKTINVTLTATDITSGADYFTYDIGNGDVVVRKADFTKNGNGVAEYTFQISAEFRNKVKMSATDVAGWTSELTETEHYLVVDSISPILEVKYDFTGSKNTVDTYYTNNDVTVKFEIKDDNFDLRKADPVFMVGSMKIALTWVEDKAAGVWKAEQLLSGDNTYNLTLTFSDASGNEMADYAQTIIIDSVAPVISSNYGIEAPVKDNIFNTARTATFTITESNFNAEDVVLNVTAENITGETVDISSKHYKEYAKNPANWSHNGNIHTIVLPAFDIDAIYTVDIDYIDLAKNRVNDYPADEFIFDDTPAKVVDISYSTPVWQKVLSSVTFGAYEANVVVTVTTEDITSGVDYVNVTYTRSDGASVVNSELIKVEKLDAVQQADKKLFVTTYTLPANARGTILADVYDNAALNSATDDKPNNVVVVDDKDPTRTVSYDPYKVLKADTLLEVDNYSEGDNSILYYNGDAVVTFAIDEANFDLSLTEDDKKPVITVNDSPVTVDWMQNGDVWTTNYTISGDGTYIVKMVYADVSGNEMLDYTSCPIIIDTTAPVIPPATFVNGEVTQEIDGVKYYKSSQTVTVVINDDNFRADDVILDVTAVDVSGNLVDISSKNYLQFAKTRSNWSSNGNTHTLTLPIFDIDARYTLDVDYDDIADNQVADYITDVFVVDHAAPTGTVTVEYKTPVIEKVLSAITFGYYNPSVTVVVTASDITSGVDYFNWTYNREDNVSTDKNVATESGKITTDKLTYSEDGKVATGEFTLTANETKQYRGNITITSTDRASNTSAEYEDIEYISVVDTIDPTRSIEFSDARVLDRATMTDVAAYAEGDDVILYYENKAEVTITVNEANFYSEDVAVTLTKNGSDSTPDVVWTDESADKHIGKFTISGDGDYFVKVAYTDRSGNEMVVYNSQEIRIDDTDPVIQSVVYTPANANANGKYFNTGRKAIITIVDHNFLADDVAAVVTAVDVQGNKIANADTICAEFATYLKTRSSWSHNGDVHTAEIAFDDDAQYTFKIDYKDIIGNTSETYVADPFVVDHKEPTNLRIQYSEPVIPLWKNILQTITFGAYNPEPEINKPLKVTITADDVTSGVDYFNWTYTKEDGASNVNDTVQGGKISVEDITYSADGLTATATFEIMPQARGYITFTAMDRAGNESTEFKDDKRINIVDTIDPTRSIEFSDARVLDRATMTDVAAYAEGDDVILYYENKAEVTITVNEANFYSEDVVVTLIKNGSDSTPDVVWTDESADKHIGKFTISGDGDYFVKVAYTDRSGNEMVVYNSQEIRIDNTDPTIAADYTPDASAVNVKYYKADRKAVITIVDHNFLADDVVAVVTAVDVQGNKIANADAICAEFATYLKTRSSWSHNGDVHTAEITFDDDAQYTFKIDYKDIIGNTAETYVADPFVVDHKEPTNLKIEYSESIVDKIIETITFGFYKPEVTVTITADDITSGVDYFDWTYTQEAGTSDKNTDELGDRITIVDIEYSNNGLSAKATFKVPANARGHITVTVTDRAGNSTSKTDKNNITVVVDNIAPTISIKYEADNAETKVQFTDDDFVTVDTFAAADYAYYNGDVTAKIVINEANFFEGVQATDGVIHNVGIKLTKTDDNGNVTVYEYLPTGAVQKYDGATPKYITWTTSGDEHSFNINYADNADYVLEIEYTDLSTNDANISANDGNTATKSYKSKVVTVDKIAPVVDVKYSNEKIIHTIDGRDYFDAEQTATITVKEHNFRADDFVATVVAQDIVKADVNVEDFKATLSDDSKWTKNGNTYTITIKYSVDANYSFDYEYEDLAQNTAAAYDEDIFTVDKTAPKNLTVSYSRSVVDKILETITFGYYNAKVTVTITAEDDTAGIHRFEYAYLKSEGVSSVNAELLKAAIEEADFTVEGNKSTAIFEIPKDVLKSENQFNGPVKFVAFDRSENNIEKADTRRVIVDNIAPTATITYNDPVQKANDISYYAGNIDAKIVINEANFYSEDVVVKVNDKDVAVKWVDDSVDVHTGTFTLTEDGDYIVTVEYKDRSANEMTKYTSNRLTLDTKAPKVSVSNIKNNSANKDEKYGLTITANDINLDATSFKPVLTATIRNEDGSYGTKTVPLREMKTVVAGKTYTFTVDNLIDDAVYNLVCTLKDMSGNEYSKVALSDGKEYDEVRFSINRNGSTFAVDKNTDTLVNQYYVYSVDEDVVIEEVNVDPVETYVVKLNGEALTEGTDYTSTLSDKAGEWSKRIYVISKKLFKSEGEYSIVVESTDKADTTAYSDVKNLNVSFVVDQTAPVLTISGLENDGRYQVEEQTVTVIPTDDGGRLYSIKVIVLNSDGEPLKDANGKDISVRFEMSGEEFLTYLTENNGKITFTVPEGLENQVQIICNDCAVNADGETNEYNETYIKVTVSQSRWIIFYANKLLFYGSIAGVILLAGGISFLIFLKKRKKASK